MTFTNKPGLYSLMIRSWKFEARAFKHYVTHEVLPAIRRTTRHRNNPNKSMPPVSSFTNLKFCDYEDTWQKILSKFYTGD